VGGPHAWTSRSPPIHPHRPADDRSARRPVDGHRKGSAPPPPLANDPTQIQIFGVWHCGNHYCDWNETIDTSPDGAFDKANRWLLDRGDRTPAVNLVVLSFVNPLKLLNLSDGGWSGMIPRE